MDINTIGTEEQKIENIFIQSFSFLINKYGFRLVDSKTNCFNIPQSPYKDLNIIYSNEYVDINIEFEYLHKIWNIFIIPVNFVKYKNNTEDLKKIIIEDMKYNIYFLIYSKNQNGIQNMEILKNFDSFGDEKVFENKVIFLKEQIEHHCIDIFHGIYENLILVKNYMMEKENEYFEELKYQKEKYPEMYSSFAYFDEEGMKYVNDFNKWKNIIYQQKNKKLNEVYLKLIRQSHGK